MANTRLSQSPYLVLAANIIAIMPLGLGINAIIRPSHAVKLFEFDPPATAKERQLANGLMAVYGVRDVFMSLAIYSAAYFGSRKALGCMLIAGSAVMFVDGWVCKTYVGKGEWGHWGFAPVLTAVGAVLLGVADSS